MKISVISHSLVATRQALFFSRLGHATGNEVQEIYPEQWNNHYRRGGYDVNNAGDMMAYEFPIGTLTDVAEFHPDVIYIQNEAYCKATMQIMKWKRHLSRTKFCLFVWENIRDYEGEAEAIIKSADHVVCGNKEAEALVRKHNSKTTVLPQVGIDFDLFRPLPLKREFDAVFTGRQSPEKGIHVARKAFEDTDYKVTYATGIPYHGMPKVFSRAKIHLCPSLDTPVWKEQFAPYGNVEALACGCYIIASNTSAIDEWIGDCPGVYLTPQNDHGKILQYATETLLNWQYGNAQGARWAYERFSSQNIAEKLVEVFSKL